MELKQETNQPTTPAPSLKKDKSKVYFFVIAIVALLLTNVYFYIKFRYSGEKLYTITLQKENLQIEIDRIEAELDNIKSLDTDISLQSMDTEQNARELIASLRKRLEEGSFTESEYQYAKEEIANLKVTVSNMKEEVNSLKIKNAFLSKDKVDLTEKTINETKSKNRTNEATVGNTVDPVNLAKAATLKVSNMHINGIQLKKDGEVDIEMRARRVDKLQINFTIADNSIANIGQKEIYVRIINPKGNLIADPNNLFFVHGEKLQYTFKEIINFTNNGEEYQFLWNDESGKGFIKGAYTILLYSNNAIMGRSSAVLK